MNRKKGLCILAIMHWPLPKKHSTITPNNRKMFRKITNFKRSINNAFIIISMHVYVNNQN